VISCRLTGRADIVQAALAMVIVVTTNEAATKVTRGHINPIVGVCIVATTWAEPTLPMPFRATVTVRTNDFVAIPADCVVIEGSSTLCTHVIFVFFIIFSLKRVGGGVRAWRDLLGNPVTITALHLTRGID